MTEPRRTSTPAHCGALLSGLTRDEAERSVRGLDFDAEQGRQFSGVRGAESLSDRGSRGRRVVSSLFERQNAGDLVVAVSHGGILQQIISALLGTERI